jgi:NADP-dependent 3-hydroxy acid dehydrogenase YdfG
MMSTTVVVTGCSSGFGHPGTRPFRSVVGIDFGVRDLNASAEPHAAELMDFMGLTSFATIASAKTV